MLSPVRTDAPEATPVSIDEVKMHCRVDTDDDDSIIEGFIGAATAHVEKLLDMALVTQGWRQEFPDFVCARPAKRPVNVDSLTIRYWDADNVVRSLDGNTFRVLIDATGAFLALNPGKSWPAVARRQDAVSIEFEAGVPVADIEKAIKVAILLHVAHLYRNREAVTVETASNMLPLGYEALLWPFKKVGV